MNRGLGRRWIFKTDDQRNYFLSLLADTANRYNADWHAYCLMSNHYHLMLHTPEGNLQRIMRHINGLYTQYFNRSERRDGPLFRGRYKAILVDAESYWMSLSRYIHRNPIEAGVAARLSAYRWSSYPAYTGKAKPPEWLTTGYILGSLGRRNPKQRYAKYVAEGIEEEIDQFYRRPRRGVILGDEGFREKAVAGRTDAIDLPGLKAARVPPRLDTIVATVCSHLDVDEEEIWHKTRGRGSRSPARGITMYLCQEAGQMTLAEIADIFGLASYASAGSSIRRIRQRMEEEGGFKELVNYILLDLTPQPSSTAEPIARWRGSASAGMTCYALFNQLILTFLFLATQSLR